MESVRIFLESSTIHGLFYISKTRKIEKLFWFLVVVAGFSTASFLIYESFLSWEETPVKTNIETLPITELRLPKVTVCPPKNTFTDLNYDLLMAENITYTNKIKIEMFKQFRSILNDHIFMDDINHLEEKDRFYNWYHGLSDFRNLTIGKDHYLNTVATSGIISTQYFGNYYKPNLVQDTTSIVVKIYIPAYALDNKNVTLHINLEKNSMTDLPSGHDRFMLFDQGFTYLDPEETQYNRNYSPPNQGLPSFFKPYAMIRIVDPDILKNQNIELMPGFNLSWYYSGGDIKHEKEFNDLFIDTKDFTR